MSFAVSKPLWFLFITAGCMRFLTPDAYGIFTACLALALLTSSIGDLGTTRYATREIARRPETAAPLLINVFIGRIALATLGFAIAFAIGLALRYSSDYLWALAGAGVYAIAFRGVEYCRAYYQAFEVLRYEAVLTLLEKLAVVTFGLLALIWFANPAAAFAGMAIGMILALAANLWWVDRRLAPLRWHLFDKRYTGQVLRLALPLGIIGVLSAVPVGLTPVIVDTALGSEAAGLYGAAQRVVEAVGLLAAIMVAAVFPRFSALFHRGDRNGLKRLLVVSVAGLLMVSALAASVVSGFASPIIELLSGDPAYAAAGPILTWLVWAVPLMCVASISVNILIAAHAQRFAIITSLSAALACLILGVVAIPAFGFSGAIATFLVPWLISSILNLVECHRRISMLPNSTSTLEATMHSSMRSGSPTAKTPTRASR